MLSPRGVQSKVLGLVVSDFYIQMQMWILLQELSFLDCPNLKHQSWTILKVHTVNLLQKHLRVIYNIL